MQTKNQQVVSCPPCGENVGLPTKRGAYKAFSLISPSIGPADHFLRKGGRKGFTLIELLVVVLIIGILAAVAVPQYQMAVTKTQYNTLKIQAHALLKAVNAYYLANGTWPIGLNSLDINLPGQIHGSNDHIISIPDLIHEKSRCTLWYNANGNSGAVICIIPDGLNYHVAFQDSTTRLCRAKDKKIHKQICFNETQDESPSRGGLDFKYP